ncbi:hypothetical protein COO91_02026 [Nostoc flagelliforme CCNUN1]|uniref:Uncharacterized protein n=1 Tax=Nostoc flagelliforme CCNUN1 TaxID=2038116 RepID=A0A2K8SMR3_9NOSO|nr:hypothetical protein [Nostoc flagelliforme]AUB36125.1 hypothetical protein COO91_02026 [Nostoc flagelliforme CCNUN1]
MPLIGTVAEEFWKLGLLDKLYLDGGPSSVSLAPDVKQEAKRTCAALPKCHWIDAQAVIAQVRKFYKSYTPANELARLYANIFIALAGRQPPPSATRPRHYLDLFIENFARNKDNVVIVDNAHLLKKRTVEIFLHDAKYFGDYPQKLVPDPDDDEKISIVYNFQVYFIALMS